MNEAFYKDFIGVYDDCFSPEWCDEVISWFNSCEGLSLTRQERDGVDPLQKQDKSITIPHDTYLWEKTGSTHHSYFTECFFSQIIPEYSKHNPLLNSFPTYYIKSIKIQKTNPSEGYHVWHCEQGNVTTESRFATWTLYLNDDFDAGETEFLHQQYRLKPKKGSVCVFPAGYTHVHRGNPPINGSKYILTGWLEF